MIKIKFNMNMAYFVLVLMISLCSIALCFMLYLIIANRFFGSSIIFPLVLFGIIDAISIYLLSKIDSFVQELSINENDVIFNCVNGGKKQVKSIKLEDIESFHLDMCMEYVYRMKSVLPIYYYTFLIKLKNSNEVQTYHGKHEESQLGICSLFDIQEIIPNFTYNIMSKNKEQDELALVDSWVYYAQNKRFKYDDKKTKNNIKKVVIIGIIIYFILLFFTVYFVKG